jgi:phosphoglycerate dehydrogenase-like enzyme
MKIVIAGRLTDEMLQGWRQEFPHVEFVGAPDREKWPEVVKDADAFIGWITRDAFLAAGPRLRWVHSTAAGIESLMAIPELVESDVTVTNTRGGHANTIAEHAFAMLLGLTRNLFPAYDNQKQRIWDRPGISRGGREIGGSTLIVVGLGNIGRAIARLGVGFGMRVIGVDLRPGETPAGVEAVWGLDRLDEALGQADVVAVSTPLTAETKNLLDARRIGLIKEGAYLLVVSRGGIIDEAALVEALKSGKLAGAGLDVQATEPMPPDDPLWEAPNIIITPHTSGASRQTGERVWSITADNVRRFIKGEPLNNICDKKAGF